MQHNDSFSHINPQNRKAAIPKVLSTTRLAPDFLQCTSNSTTESECFEYEFIKFVLKEKASSPKNIYGYSLSELSKRLGFGTSNNLTLLALHMFDIAIPLPSLSLP